MPDSSRIVFSWVEYKINFYNEVLWKELDYKIKKLWKDWHLKLFKAEIDHFKGKDIDQETIEEVKIKAIILESTSEIRLWI